MSASSILPSLKSMLRSIFVPITLFAAVCIMLVVATTEYLSYRKVHAVIVENVAARASETNAVIAGQVGSAVKFGNVPAVEAFITGMLEGSLGDAQGGVVLMANGTVVYDSAGDAGADAQLLATAQAALKSGKIATDAHGLIQAAPILFGPQNGLVGVVATRWSDARQLAALTQANTRSLLLGGLMFLGALAVFAAFLSRFVTRPLLRTAVAMRRVEGGDYEIDIPGRKRADEIGIIARRLHSFSGSLLEAQQKSRERAIIGAGFAGSSAAMMLLDGEGEVRFYNESCGAFLDGFCEVFQQDWPAFDAQALVGVPLAKLAGLEEVSRRLARQSFGERLVHQMRMGRRRVEVAVDVITGDEGERIGYVVEWSDATEAALNAAVLGSIEGNQLRVDVAPGGRVISCNDKFQELTEFSLPELKQIVSVELFKAEGKTEEERAEIARQIGSGKVYYTRYWIKNKSGREVIAEGSFSPIMDENGAFERAIFLGMDVTESYEERSAARARREVEEKAQRHVVDALGEGLRGLAAGNLAVRLDEPFTGDYEAVRNDFNTALEALEVAMGAVLDNAESIRSETSEITNAADDLARRTEKQAATLEETAAAVDQLASSVESAAEGADEATKIAAHAQGNAETGGQVADQAKEAMDRIKASSAEISKITTVIDNIAFQTNLLALNAGVEAARAGDAGRGFAVVATEVRALAQRSSDAASEINNLITASSDEVKTGVDLVNRTGEALSEIVGSVRDISARVEHIASSSREQSSALGEINQAMNDLDQVTQQNAAMFEETTAASHALTSEANSLAQAVSRFSLSNGKGPAARPARPRVVAAPPAARGPAPAARIHRPTPPSAMTAQAAEVQTDNDDWEDF